MFTVMRSTSKPSAYCGGFPVVALVIEEDDREGYAELWRVDADNRRWHGFNFEISLWPKADADPREAGTAYGIWWWVDYEFVDRLIEFAMSLPEEEPH